MTVTMNIDLKDLVRTIPDYPKPGIMFRDITTLLGHANGFRACVEQLAMPFVDRRVQMVAGIEARGFILGGAVADRLRCGFVPIRTKGKLPGKAIVIDLPDLGSSARLAKLGIECHTLMAFEGD